MNPLMNKRTVFHCKIRNQMIDGSECGIVSHLQLIFGSLPYGETCGKFPKPLAKFCLPLMGPSRGKEAPARLIREMVL
ncbi:hypothetical protein CEXT_221331 [Caerostris extrusa]|uniref:Uncharacterized protein n=1 Tax=Caerostris extrusa TaxID=172846 RepID=A0AAV4U914_CAEEX|nr:hypothetical protein CEXT_221331 [Caerostris extrusa]